MRVEIKSLASFLALLFLIAPLSIHAVEKTKPAPGNSAHADQETNLAAQAYQSGDYTAAAAHFKQVLKLDPGNVKAWLFLGQSSAKLNDNMGARRAFAKVLALQASGPVAERAIEQLSKLPEPDLFAMQLDSGITLGDWMKFAQKQIAEGKRDAVLNEISQHLRQFGPVPQLLTLQDKLQREAQAEQEQKLDAAIKAIKLTDADSAKAALPQIRNLRQQAPNSLRLIQLEARACHYLQDFACAEKSYAAWIKAAPANDPKRESMVEALMQAKQHEALPTVLAGAKAVRPKLPFELSEDVWRALEASPVYLNWPEPRKIEFSFEGREEVEHTGSKSSSLPKPEVKTVSGHQEWTPLGDRCSEFKSMVMSTYVCGKFIPLGSIDRDGKDIGYIKSIDEIDGSLFPMHIGAKMRLRYQEAFVLNRKYDSTSTLYCEAMDREVARGLHQKLTGTAWRVRCHHTLFMEGKTVLDNERDDYYLEDLGVFMSQIGQLDFEKKKYVLPSPGSQTVLIVDGEYGSRHTTTYSRYDWSVGE